MKSFKQFLTEKYNINTVNIKCMPGFFDFMLNFSKKNKYAKMIIDDSIYSQRFNPNKYYELCEDLLNTSNYYTKLGNNKDAQNYYNEYLSCREVLDCIDDLVNYEQNYKHNIQFEDKILKKQYTFKSNTNIQYTASSDKSYVIYPDAKLNDAFIKNHKDNMVMKCILKQSGHLHSTKEIAYNLSCYLAMINNPYFKKYVNKNEQKEIEKIIIDYNNLTNAYPVR